MANKNLDEYEKLSFYKTHSKARENGFAKFSENGKHYFALYKGGDIVLISQAYKNISGRDNGIESVRKNGKIKARYKFDERAGNKYGFGLMAGNGQEIGVSANHATRAQAENAAGRMNGSVRAPRTTAQPRAAVRPKVAAKPRAMAKPKAAKKPRKANDEDNYQRLAFYEKHTKGRKNGIERFKGSDGLYYFAHFENGKIQLISEGYPTVNARETGAASVEKNIKIEKRYEYRGPFKNGKYDYRLKAGNGKEIARSVWYGSAAAAATGAAYLIGTRKRSAPVKTVAPKKVVATKKKASPKKKTIAKAAAAAAIVPAAAAAAYRAPIDKDDDYLKCEEYHGHKVTDKVNNVAFFSHKNNQEYFVLYDSNGDVRLRSEGFNSISKRSSELAAVLRLKDTKSAYKRIEKNGYYMDVLYDETGREVGRSCLRKIKPVVAAAPIAAAAPVAAAAAAVPVAAATGGFNWGFLKWLLPLLLLLLAAIFLMKSCKPKAAAPIALITCWDGSKSEGLNSCPDKVTCWDGKFVKAASSCAPEPVTCWDGSKAATLGTCPAKPEPKPEPKPAPVKAPKPASIPAGYPLCGPSNTAIFNVPTYQTPTNVIRLGTYPEFGDSHGLSPREFYNKLQNRYNSSQFDASYLNYLARSLGYAGGFSEMSANDFSNDRLAKGAKGLLGYGEQHAYAYSQLNVRTSRDLEAFRVRGTNGQTVHFMKSCGNYMYVCE